MNKKATGRKGEDIAATFLIDKGYDVLYRNWTCRWGELDLITKFKDVLVFVEVKFRSSLDFGYPYEAVNYKKKTILARSIKRFLTISNLWDYNWRLDLISIYVSGGNTNIKHFESIEMDGIF
ncbi:YraN family protein [candidate division WWE3 bacterium RIFCSPLOWO2_12_FULL_36_10]|uniref:UPF0102 protein A3H26_01955 n=1 Tax=candidate division WWE3 bacterium RIFCSPLOWO2_12_FULL_36_10 TaxID=1802630 RepID=A0A1F4VGU0_UNCKA|nr:MAG: YraN family protein [candidate division WWE3 bacterium RIFCSPLOWO2_12_FULL_36_10]